MRVTIPSVDDIIGEFYEFVAAEGNLKGYREILEGEDMIDEYKTVATVFGLPNCLINCLSSVIKKFKPRFGFIASKSTSKDAHEFLKLSYRHIVHKQEFVNMWRKQNLDVLICPGFGAQALKHGLSQDCTLAAGYTFIWNMLETPTGNLPITKVQADEEIYHQTFNDPINEGLSQNARGSAGLPVGIQVVGMPYQDERVLGVMRLIEHLFPFYQQNSFPK